ncbi:hypothetical protein ACQCVH_07965 [Bacillus infantis]|uniref:hypothetical protein n=1 Tax=Bacillus infantis TaxID=324767 RepID=UPI003CF7D764
MKNKGKHYIAIFAGLLVLLLTGLVKAHLVHQTMVPRSSSIMIRLKMQSTSLLLQTLQKMTQIPAARIQMTQHLKKKKTLLPMKPKIA